MGRPNGLEQSYPSVFRALNMAPETIVAQIRSSIQMKKYTMHRN